MASGSRLFVAAWIVAVSACGLVYDVDSITDDTCGIKNGRCCPGQSCGDGLVCLSAAKDGGTDAGCPCPATDGAAGADTQSAAACACETEVCRSCGGPNEPCCDHSACLADELKCETDEICRGSCGGKDGDPCCKETSKPCGEGLACDDKDVCHTETPPCGAQGQDCCAGSCNGGLTCQGETCQPPVVGDCGGPGEACCTNGNPLCEASNLKCINNVCTGCGSEGAPCCDNPLCNAAGLSCDAGGICRTCPYAGAPCGTDLGRVCQGTGGGEQCAVCGGLGNLCCSSVVAEPCPNEPFCCNGTAADGCNACSGVPCTCKVCCVRCGNWAAGSYQKLAVGPGECDGAGDSLCAGKGGKAFAQFRNACPP